MNVSHQVLENLTGQITIQVKSEDYSPKVEETLKKYRKQAQMPGFRKGMVPAGMVRKMYGKSIMAEELNKMLLDSLYGYISEQKIDLLGNPLPKTDEMVDFDPNNFGDFTFNYEIGLAPTFDLKLSEKDKFDYYKVKVDATLIEKYNKDLQKRYGKVKEVEKSQENDMLSGKFEELNADGSIKEGGISSTSTIALEFLEDEKIKKALTGKKVSDSIALDPEKVSKGHDDMGKMLGVDHDRIHQLIHDKVQFQFTIEKVYEIEPAEMNEAFYEMLFGKDAVKDQTEFDAKIAENLGNMFANDSDKLLFKQVREELIERTKLELPDAFLKRWLVAANEGKLTPDVVEKEYKMYAETVRWQLIENKLIKNHEISVPFEDVKEYAKQLIRNQYAQYGIPDIDDSLIEENIKEFLKNEEQVRQINETLYDNKLLQAIKATCKLKEKEVDYDEFVKLATGKAPKKGLLSNIKSMFE